MTPNARRTAIQINVSKDVLRRKKKNEHTLLKFSFELVLEYTLGPPLRLGSGPFSALDPCIDLDLDLDLEGPLLPLVDLDPDLFKVRLAVLAMSVSTLPLEPNKRHQHLQPLR